MSPNIFGSIGRGAPAIQNTLTEMEERPRRELAFENNMAIQGQQRAINQLGIEEGQMKLAQMKKQQEWANGMMDITAFPMYQEMSREVQNKLKSDFQKAGITDQYGRGRRGDVVNYLQMMKNKPDMMKDYMTLELNNRQQAYFDAEDKLRKDKENAGDSGFNFDPAKREKLEATVSNSKQAYDQFLQRMPGFEKEVMSRRQQEQTRSVIGNAVNQLQKSGKWDSLAPEIQMGLTVAAQTGDTKMAEQAIANASKGQMTPYQAESLRLKGQQIEATKESKEADRALREKLGSKIDDALNKQLINKTLTELPKLKASAVAQNTNIDNIDRALDLVKGSVTGKGGQVKAFLAPYAEMAGINIKSLSDAQTFQLLTRAIVGPMRLDIVGPGPVSEWEQKLMQQISGGGGAAKDAAIELLSAWRRKAEDKIESYNSTLQGLTDIYPQASKIYKPIGGEKAKSTETKPTGKVKFTEGSNVWDIPPNMVDEFKKSHPKAIQHKQTSQNVPQQQKGTDYSTWDDDTLLMNLELYQSNTGLQREAERRWGKDWRKKLGGKSMVG